MVRPGRAEPDAVRAFLAGNPGWTQEGAALVRSFSFLDFAGALAFAVRVGLLAEKHDHHPDLHVAWGKVRVIWTTHDAGGITELDLKLAGLTDRVSG